MFKSSKIINFKHFKWAQVCTSAARGSKRTDGGKKHGSKKCRGTLAINEDGIACENLHAPHLSRVKQGCNCDNDNCFALQKRETSIQLLHFPSIFTLFSCLALSTLMSSNAWLISFALWFHHIYYERHVIQRETELTQKKLLTCLGVGWNLQCVSLNIAL